jgi:putative RecB family exonuclease
MDEIDEGPDKELLPALQYISAFSASSSGTFEQCPKQWYFKYVAKLPDPPGEDAILGTFTHSVLELLLQEPAIERTKERAKVIAREIWPEIEQDTDFITLSLNEAEALAFRQRSWTAIEGLWDLEKPQDVIVDSTEFEVKVEIAGIPFRGYIDRVDQEQDGLVVTDYKSGKAPKDRYMGNKLHQVLLYAAALEALNGDRPQRARLFFLNNRNTENQQNRRIVEVDVNDKTLSQTTKKLQRTWQDLNRACEDETFPTKPQILCKWCSFLPNCSEGKQWVSTRKY